MPLIAAAVNNKCLRLDSNGEVPDSTIPGSLTDVQLFSVNTLEQNTWFTQIHRVLPTEAGTNVRFFTDTNNVVGTWTGTPTYTAFAYGDNGHFAEVIMGPSSTNAAFGDGKDIRIKFRMKMPSGTSDRGMGLAVAGSTLRANRTTTAACVMFSADSNTLYAVNADGVTNTNTDISAGITLTNWNTYEIIWTDGTSAAYYVNGTLVATHTTNLPTASDIKLGFGTDVNDGTFYLSDIVISQEL